MARRLFDPFEVFLNSAGTPRAGGKLYFYDTGTTNPRATYSNTGLSIANSNPIVLDSAGRLTTNVYGSGDYKVVLTNSDGTDSITIDAFEDLDATQLTTDATQLLQFAGAQGTIPVVATVAALRLLSTFTGAPARILLKGYSSDGDGGGGILRHDYTDTTTSDDDVVNFVDAAGRRWKRELSTPVLTPQMAGAKGDGTTDDAPALRAVLSYIALNPVTLRIPKKTYLMQSLVTPSGLSSTYQCFATIPQNCRIEAEPGATLKAAAGLSTAGNWSFLVGNFTSDFKNIAIRGITFDFNGANNLTPSPSGTYRTCLGVWILMQSGATTGGRVEISDCDFLDNPGANSISVVDEAPSGTSNRLTDVVIERNLFKNFGYAVGNNANVNNDDHSCIYIQARRVSIEKNFFVSDYLVPEAYTGGHSCIDLHSEHARIAGNLVDGAITFIVHQCNSFKALDTQISENVARNLERFYAPFDGSQFYQNCRIADNTLSMRATTRDLPVLDFWNAISTTGTFIYAIDNNTAYWGGTVTGRSAMFLKAKRGTDFSIINNKVFNCPGKAIYVQANASVYRLSVRGNQIVGYGAGGVAGTDIGVDLDMTATGTDHTGWVTGNLFSWGTLGSARGKGVQFSGAWDRLFIHNNDHDHVTTWVSTPSFGVTGEWYIEERRYYASANLTFSAPGTVPGQTEQNITVTGAKLGDMVKVGSPAAHPSDMILQGYVSAADTVSVRWEQMRGAAAAPPSGAYYKIEVLRLM